MAWTYDPALLNDAQVGSLMQMRLILSDTNEDDQQLQDEEIQFYLDSESSVYMAAAHAAQSLASKYARLADKQVGDLKISYQKVSDRYLDIAERLESKGRPYQVPSAGGVYTADRDRNQDDESLLHSYIRRGIHDY